MRSSQDLVITVFGSARPQPGSDAYRSAQELGAALAQAGFVVANGGYGGTMEAAARGAREAGGWTIGVTADKISTLANRWIQEQIRVADWRDRLFKLIELGHGYVALPGGTGTLAELAVVWEMVNKCLLPVKPLVLLGEHWLPVVNTVPPSELNSKPIVQAQTVPEAVATLRRYLGDPGRS